jgi:hypothetical protein
MSDSTTPGRSPTRGRRRSRLRFCLLVAIAWAWMRQPPIGMPGDPEREDGTAICRKCHSIGIEQRDGSYICKNGHIFSRNAKKKARKNKAGK